MNRLIIIGNGFDLAHGIKTSYLDFISSYIDEIINQIKLTGQYKFDGLIHIYPETEDSHEEDNLRWKVIKSDLSIKTPSEKLKHLRNIGYKLTYLNNYIDKIFNTATNGWCDLESIYYKELKYIIFETKTINRANIIDDVIILNNAFDLLKDRLIIYLNSLEIKPYTMKGIIGLEEIINMDINYDNFIRYNKKVKNQLNYRSFGEKAPKEMQILNFNYTPTIFRYFSEEGKKEMFNFIHGRIDEKINNIIFGYGDEMDSKSKEIDEFDENRYLTHFKSFMYGKTSNYHNLINFINKDEFEVFIFGHSCGLSDRTMLNKIFEDENCIHIKIFYHERNDGTDDFDEKYFNISRHFNNKNKMREKILPKEKSIPFPQINNE